MSREVFHTCDPLGDPQVYQIGDCEAVLKEVWRTSERTEHPFGITCRSISKAWYPRFHLVSIVRGIPSSWTECWSIEVRLIAQLISHHQGLVHVLEACFDLSARKVETAFRPTGQRHGDPIHDLSDLPLRKLSPKMMGLPSGTLFVSTSNKLLLYST